MVQVQDGLCFYLMLPLLYDILSHMKSIDHDEKKATFLNE